jgi:hypothetical protein
MTLTVLATSVVSSGTLWLSNASGDAFWLPSGVFAANTSGIGILSRAQDTNIAVTIDGDLMSSAASAISIVSAFATVEIGLSGTVRSSPGGGVGAIGLTGGHADCHNAGEITALNGIGVVLGGGTNTLANDGSIWGRDCAVFMGALGSSLDTLINTGTLTAGTTQLAGQIRFGHAVHIEGNDATVINSGLISATGLGTYNAIHIGDGSVNGSFARITNLAGGEIVAAASQAISAANLVNGTVTIANAGSITGHLTCIASGANAITLQNGGTLSGQVNFAAATSADLRNAGEINGGISMGLASGNTLHNSGTITGNIGQAGGSLSLVNRGMIDGFLSADGAIALRNFGTIAGALDLNGGAGANTVLNRGTIEGDVTLAQGGSYQGAHGHLWGQITALSGSASIVTGEDDDIITTLDAALTVNAGAGDDIITAGSKIDALAGGTGADRFIFTKSRDISLNATKKADMITDFELGADRIDLSAFMHGGSFIGNDPFTGTAGEVRYLPASGKLSGDVDGDGAADWLLLIDNRAALTTGDFIF